MGPPRLDELSHRLGIALRDPEVLRQALVHSSYYNENPNDVVGHNERLEFLGDAVIGLAVSRLLYERYPDEDEGFLTARRASLVNRDALAELALALHLDGYLLLGRGEADAGGASRPSLLAATFEAVAGAIVLSAGLEPTIAWLHRLFEDRLDVPGGEVPPKSAKSRLQEWSQRQLRTKPHYEVLETTGPPHDQRFTVVAILAGRRLATGIGSSRQRAEEEAAAESLAQLEAEPTAGTRPSHAEDMA